MTRLLASCLMLLRSRDSAPYFVRTQDTLASRAVATSRLWADASFLTDLGLPTVDNASRGCENSEGRRRSIADLVRDGARFEDNALDPAPLRFRSHFYDPARQTGLTDRCASPVCVGP
jgi:hypothetical protein